MRCDAAKQIEDLIVIDLLVSLAYPSLSVCPSVCLPVCLCACPPVYLSVVCLAVCLSVCLSICPSIYVPACLPACLPVYPSVARDSNKAVCAATPELLWTLLREPNVSKHKSHPAVKTFFSLMLRRASSSAATGGSGYHHHHKFLGQ